METWKNMQPLTAVGVSVADPVTCSTEVVKIIVMLIQYLNN